jgi:hypothetical protein
MKKFSLGLILALVALGLSSAQGFPGSGPYGQTGPQQGQVQVAGQAPVAKSLDGKLAFSGEYPAIQAKDKTYILRMPRFYYYAYTEGFKAGDQVHVDGYELPLVPGQDKPYFLVTKAVVNGKTYDFTAAFGHGGMMGGRGYGPGMMGGQGYGPGMMGGRGGRW